MGQVKQDAVAGFDFLYEFVGGDGTGCEPLIHVPFLSPLLHDIAC